MPLRTPKSLLRRKTTPRRPGKKREPTWAGLELCDQHIPPLFMIRRAHALASLPFPAEIEEAIVQTAHREELCFSGGDQTPDDVWKFMYPSEQVFREALEELLWREDDPVRPEESEPEGKKREGLKVLRTLFLIVFQCQPGTKTGAISYGEDWLELQKEYLAHEERFALAGYPENFPDLLGTALKFATQHLI